MLHVPVGSDEDLGEVAVGRYAGEGDCLRADGLFHLLQQMGRGSSAAAVGEVGQSLETRRSGIDRARNRLAGKQRVGRAEGGDQVDELKHRGTGILAHDIAGVVDRPSICRAGQDEIVFVGVRKISTVTRRS